MGVMPFLERSGVSVSRLRTSPGRSVNRTTDQQAAVPRAPAHSAPGGRCARISAAQLVRMRASWRHSASAAFPRSSPWPRRPARAAAAAGASGCGTVRPWRSGWADRFRPVAARVAPRARDGLRPALRSDRRHLEHRAWSIPASGRSCHDPRSGRKPRRAGAALAAAAPASGGAAADAEPRLREDAASAAMRSADGEPRCGPVRSADARRLRSRPPPRRQATARPAAPPAAPPSRPRP